MFTKPSSYNQQCIIQWYAKGADSGNHQRNQRYFSSSNSGSQDITQGVLDLSHANRFQSTDDDDERHERFSRNSYTISRQLFMIKTVPNGTTDIFLYGHSTHRDYVRLRYPGGAQDVRGISVDGHYVSAAKVAGFLDEACSVLKTSPLRIWLLSCHSGKDDLSEVYAIHLARKLKARGWRNKRLIGFKREVTTTALEASRQLAARTDLFRPMDWPKLYKWRPILVTIDKSGEIDDEDKYD